MATLRGLAAWLLPALAPSFALACSCVWQGPFCAVADAAPLIVHGRILRHHGAPTSAMDVLVLEVLKGGLLDSGLRVAMGDGMHCRPSAAEFPPGSEWILALNGPGAKPGNGLALSHCGEYWLRVDDAVVSGQIVSGATSPQHLPLDELRRLLSNRAPSCRSFRPPAALPPQSPIDRRSE